jgi:hypothetical protein
MALVEVKHKIRSEETTKVLIIITRELRSSVHLTAERIFHSSYGIDDAVVMRKNEMRRDFNKILS